MNTTYTVPAISCHHCTATIERELKMVPGVASVKAEMESKQVDVEVKDASVLAAVEAMLEEIGYPAQK
jgi:copper chaperone